MLKLAILNDFLRDTPNGLDNCVANRRWLAAKTIVLGKGRYQVFEYGYDQTNEQHTDIAKYMDSLGLRCRQESWSTLWDSDPSDLFCELLSDNLTNPDCVVGFGLPNILVRAFDKLAIPFVDFEISPIRFLSDLHVDARTNMKALKESTLWEHPSEEIYHQAASIAGWAARQCPDSIPEHAGRVGVIFGQLAQDASLIYGNKMASFWDFKKELKEWGNDLDHILFKPHPYDQHNVHLKHLAAIFPDLQQTNMNCYQLLGSLRIQKVLALSSSVLEEAHFFGYETKRLVMTPRRRTKEAYSLVSNLGLLSTDVLMPAIKDARPLNCQADQTNLRDQFGINWAFPPTVVPSDFNSSTSLKISAQCSRAFSKAVSLFQKAA